MKSDRFNLEQFRKWQEEHSLSYQQLADLMGWSREEVKRPTRAADRDKMDRLVHRFLLLVERMYNQYDPDSGIDPAYISGVLDEDEGVEPRPVFSGAEARRLLSEGQKPAEIAKAFGVPLQRVSAIARKMREESVL